MKTIFNINFNDKVHVYLTQYGKERFKNQDLLKSLKSDNSIELSLKELSYNMGHLFFNGAMESIVNFHIHCSRYPNSYVSLNAIAIVNLTDKGKKALKDNYKQYDVGGGYVDRLIESLTQEVTRTELHDILFTFNEVAMKQDILFEKETIQIEDFSF